MHTEVHKYLFLASFFFFLSAVRLKSGRKKSPSDRLSWLNHRPRCHVGVFESLSHYHRLIGSYYQPDKVSDWHDRSATLRITYHEPFVSPKSGFLVRVSLSRILVLWCIDLTNPATVLQKANFKVGRYYFETPVYIQTLIYYDFKFTGLLS